MARGAHLEDQRQRLLYRVGEAAGTASEGAASRRKRPARRRRSEAWAKAGGQGQEWKRGQGVSKRSRSSGVGISGASSIGAEAMRQSSEPHQRVPGSGASAVHGQRIWHEIFGFLGGAKSKFSLVWHSLRAKPAEAQAGPKRQVWPVHLPFPEMFRRGAKRSQKDGSRKLGFNFVILVMNFWLAGTGIGPSARAWPPLSTSRNGGWSNS